MKIECFIRTKANQEENNNESIFKNVGLVTTPDKERD